MGITHLTDSPDGLKFEGLSNVYRDDEVEFLDSASPSTLLDVRHLSTDELREQLLALRRLRRASNDASRRSSPRKRLQSDPVAKLRAELASLTPEEREALRDMLQGGDG